VVAGDGEADLTIGLETAAGGAEAEGGRAQGVGGREYDAPVVDAVGEWGVGWPAKCEMPLKEVRF
jgi:hypothetical protein